MSGYLWHGEPWLAAANARIMTDREDQARVSGPKPPSPLRKPIAHGTLAGYSQHRNRGEKPCEECKAADLERQRANRRARLGKPLPVLADPNPMGGYSW